MNLISHEERWLNSYYRKASKRNVMLRTLKELNMELTHPSSAHRTDDEDQLISWGLWMELITANELF
jgi:hypothetical protein